MNNLELKIADIQELSIHEMKTQIGGCTMKKFKHPENYYDTEATGLDVQTRIIRCSKSICTWSTWKARPLR